LAIDLTATRTTWTTRESDIAKAVAKLKPASSIRPQVKIVVYGRNKQGKTVFACTSKMKTLLIDCNERGYASVRKNDNVTIYELQRWDDLDPIYWYLRSGKHDFEVVVIDTVTMLANICMKWVLRENYDRDMTADIMTPDKRSWGKLGEALKETIIRFRNLPMHVIFTAQEKATTSEDDEGGTVTEIHPELSPSPRSTLLSAVDIIGRIYVKEVELPDDKKRLERRMLLGAHPKFVAGNRFSELKYVERNPTFGGFIEKIMGEITDASPAK
jgi:phage nucleotide-binding protein